jgi:hypothetical protein
VILVDTSHSLFLVALTNRLALLRR